MDDHDPDEGVGRALNLRVEPLLQVAGALDVGVDALSNVERVDRLAGTFKVRSAAVSGLTVEVLDAFASEYGDAGRLEIRTGDLPDLTVAGGFDHADVERLRSDAAAGSTTYDVVIEIDKVTLGRQLVPEAGNATVRVFFFATVLGAHLARGPRAVERELWSHPDTRLVVAVLDTDLMILGDCLSIVGGAYLATAPEESRRPVPSGLSRMAARRNDYVGWDGDITTSLTPTHFLRSRATDESALDERLDVLVVGLGAMYLCDRGRYVERPDGTTFIQAEFRGREHVAFVPIDWTATLPGVEAKHVNAVAGVVDWCYEVVAEHRSTDMVGDRLPFVQTRVAQLLEGRPEQSRVLALALAMPAIGEGVKWHWRAFIEGRVNEYLDHVRELETAVGDLVGRLSEQTSTLVKRLSETSLAAVAALIGSFIAAAFKQPFQADLFRIGMLAYAGYVVVFPLAIGVSSVVGDSRVADVSFVAQRRNLSTVLGDDRVDELVGGRIATAKNRFRFWARLVGVAYVGAAVAAVIAAATVPSVVGSTVNQKTTTSTTTSVINSTTTASTR